MTTCTAPEISKGITDDVFAGLLSIQRNLNIADAATASTVRQTIAILSPKAGQTGVGGTYGEETVVKVVCAVLRLFNDGLNTTERMGPRQLVEYSMLWVEMFPHETVKDLFLCLKWVKAGRYGPLFNRVDGTVISEFFRKYLDEKSAYLETARREIQNQFKKETKTLASLPKEQVQAITNMIQRQGVKSTLLMPLRNEKEYREYIHNNVTRLSPSDLEEIRQRAVRQCDLDFMELTVNEIDRRNKQRNQLFTDYETETEESGENKVDTSNPEN